MLPAVAPLVGLRLVLAPEAGRWPKFHHHLPPVRLLREETPEHRTVDLVVSAPEVMLLAWLLLVLLEARAPVAVWPLLGWVSFPWA